VTKRRACGGGPRVERFELLFELNEEIRRAAGTLDAHEPGLAWEFRCECGVPDCNAMVEVGLEEFDALQASGKPILAEGHSVSAATSARRRAGELREEAAALRAQAQHQTKRARRNTAPPQAEPCLVVDIPTSSFIAAVDLEIRLRPIVLARVIAAEEPTVTVSCPRSRLQAVLKSLSAWLEDFGADELQIWVERRPYTLQRSADTHVRWVDAEGSDLDDVELDSRDSTT
jgi:hypothetical protein